MNRTAYINTAQTRKVSFCRDALIPKRGKHIEYGKLHTNRELQNLAAPGRDSGFFEEKKKDTEQSEKSKPIKLPVHPRISHCSVRIKALPV